MPRRKLVTTNDLLWKWHWGEDAPEDAHSRYEQRRQELQVRLTAQRILTAHVKPEAAAVFWADIDLDLTEAHLHQLNLNACHVRRAEFVGATFTGDAWFRAATFTEYAWFRAATFTGDAWFRDATFAGGRFGRATFAGYAEFSRTTFARDARFGGATFAGETVFDGAKVNGEVEFGGARVAPSSRRIVLPGGWITRAAWPAEGEEEGWLYVVRDEDSSEQPAEAPNDGPA